jgi:DNA repair ATPase RecN
MSALIRWTFPLVAYLCVGTVVSALLGYGYLRSSGKLNDDTMFRITALLHGVDLEALAHEGQKTVEGTPPEEPSYAEQQRQLQAATLQFDAKQKQLDEALNDFNYQLKRVSEATDRYAQLRVVVENYLKGESEALANKGLAEVRAQLESLDPKKQAKPILVEYIKAGRIDEVIQLLGGMKARNRENILKTFNIVPDDILMLFDLQKHMLDDNPAKAIVEEQLKALNQLKSQEK